MKASRRTFLPVSLFVAGALCAMTGSGLPARSAETIHLANQTVRVIDGDSFQVGGIVIQLAGIDAPELGQVCDNDGHPWPCGMVAAYELRKLLSFEKQEIICYPQGVKDGGVVANCAYGDNDISRAVLQNGNAMASPGAPWPYVNAERKTQHASLGVWRGDFIPPWDWRRGKRLQREPAFMESHEMRGDSSWKWGGVPLLPKHSTLHSACLIKGSRLTEGKNLYFSPLDEGYREITIDNVKGERFFCSDDDARHAGWRRPGEK